MNMNDSPIITSCVFFQHNFNPLMKPLTQDQEVRKRGIDSGSLMTVDDNDTRRKRSSIRQVKSLTSSVTNTTSDFDPLKCIFHESDWDIIQSPLSVFEDEVGSNINYGENSIKNYRSDANYNHIILSSSVVALTSGVILKNKDRTSETNTSCLVNDGVLFNQLCRVLKEQEKLLNNQDNMKSQVLVQNFFPLKEIRFDSSTDYSTVVSDLSIIDENVDNIDDNFDDTF